MGLLLMTPHEVVEIAFRGVEAMDENMIGEAPILTAQYKFIRPVLGKLYEALLEGKYPELLNGYVKAPLAHYVKWLLLPRLSVQCGGIGVVQFKGENFSAAGDGAFAMLRQQVRSDAQALMKRVIERIELAPEEFPEYDPEQNVLHRVLLLGDWVL